LNAPETGNFSNEIFRGFSTDFSYRSHSVEPMAKRSDQWQPLQMPLSGPLDTRSRPADTGPGTLRFKLNLAINTSGKLSRRAGHAALNFGPRSDSPDEPVNWDFHRRDQATREPVTWLSEIVSIDRTRYLYEGSQSTVAWLDNETSQWHTIINGIGNDKSRWKGAALNDKIVFSDTQTDLRIADVGSAAAATTIVDLIDLGLSAAKVVVEFSNVIVLMNFLGKEYDPDTGNPTGAVRRFANRVQWSDFRTPDSFELGDPESIAGFQDLGDGETILNAGLLGGVLWIFTDRAIWHMTPAAVNDADIVFNFRRWYTEPRNRTGCLKYDNALVATGREFFWLGSNSIFWANQFSTAPTAPDWLLMASGTMFEGDQRVDPAFCESPVGEMVPDAEGNAREVWFSYPRLGSEEGVNDFSIVLSFNTDSRTSSYQTASYVDHGYTAFTNFSFTTETGLTCATTATFVGASGQDFCLKSIGGVYYRETVVLIGGDVATDIPDDGYTTTQEGYYTQLTFMVPFGQPQREKTLRNVLLEHDTADEETDTPNQVALRIGNSFHIADPVLTNGRCNVQFHDMGTRDLLCPDVDSAEQMVEDGTRPDDLTEWDNLSEQSRFLYADFKVTDFSGGAPIGSDSAWNSVTFDFLTLP
jgi:hypothetical protein